MPNVGLGAAITNVVAARLAELSVVTVVSSDERATWSVGGSVQRIGDVVRVTARLVDVERGAVLKAVKVDGSIDALAELWASVEAALSESIRDVLSAQGVTDSHGADADVAGSGRRS